MISIVNRGFSFLTGFIGSGSPRNACKRCGYKWKPEVFQYQKNQWGV